MRRRGEMTRREAKILMFRYVFSFASVLSENVEEDRLLEMTENKEEREMLRKEAEWFCNLLVKHVKPTKQEMNNTDKWYMKTETDEQEK